MSALQACESSEYCQSREGKNIFFSLRNSTETVVVSVPLDVLKQYFCAFRKNEPVASAQFLEERTFVPSAVSVPLKPLFRCENQCSEKTLSYWQLASVVLNEGDEAYMTNLNRKCFKKHLQAKKVMPLSSAQWRQVVEQRAFRGRMWTVMEKEPYLRGMWEYFLQERSKVSRVGRRRKAGRNTRSMAAGIGSKRVPGTTEMLP